MKKKDVIIDVRKLKRKNISGCRRCFFVAVSVDARRDERGVSDWMERIMD